MKEMEKHAFGRTKSGAQAHLYTLTNEAGMSVSLTEYGATLVKLLVPDSTGSLRDVVLGYEDVSG